MTTNPPAHSATGGRPPREHSFASLNFLRGLSAFVVLTSHAVANTSDPRSLLNYPLGSLAVDVFMLISGFLMMWHFYERGKLGESWNDPRTCLKFYTRRFFRISPLYYCLLLVVYVFHGSLAAWTEQTRALQHQAAMPGWHDVASERVTAAHVLSHFTFLFGFIPHFAESSFLPDWSIGLEMQFYLFFPFLALLLDRTQFVGGVAVLLACKWLALGCFSVPQFPTFLPLRISCFLAGMLIAAGLFERGRPVRRILLLLLGLVVAGLYMEKFFLICCALTFYELSAAGGTGLPIAHKMAGWLGRLFEFRLFTFAADASYGVYLIHVPLLILVMHFLPAFCPFESFSPARQFCLIMIVMLPLVYALAYLGFKFVETPGIAWGRRLVKRIARHDPVPAARANAVS